VNPALANLEAERTVLGCVLLDSGCLYRALPHLQPQDFSLDSHRRIYHTIAELAEAGKPVDDLTLADALIEKGQLESVGGVAYLGNLSDNTLR
jgi:replicative DNA helicase